MKSAARPSTRSRSKKKAVPAPSAVEPAPAVEIPAEVASADTPRNVDSLEGLLSMVLGILLVIGALFPRSLKQLLMLGLGGGLLYRGITGKSELYRALGIDTQR